MPREQPFCVILGAGGHAGVLIDALQEARIEARLVALDANEQLWGTDVFDVRVEGGDDRLPALVNAGADSFIVGLGATGDNRPRRRLFELGTGSGLRTFEVVHPRSWVSSRARRGPGCQLLAGAVVNAGALLGSNVIVNSGAIVEHDCHLGSHVHVASGARLCSAVRIGEGAHIGAGATVRQGVRIGDWAVVGVGAAVVDDIPSGSTVVGVPARAIAGKRAR